MTELERKLAYKNEETVPGSLGQAYSNRVTYYIRHGCPQSPKGYSQSDVEAIQFNYTKDPQNPQYVQELNKFQEHRIVCKATAKAEFGITED
ncbi:MAG: hypothetical protein IJX51_08785 [Clostridia bacterium]|nr:hypothetical protein [Clostridia bacterium]